MMATWKLTFCLTVGLVSLTPVEGRAQYRHYQNHGHHNHHHSTHHHHDAAGHRVDDAGHHIDLYGRHTGAVGVYDNGAYSAPRSIYAPTVGVGAYYGAPRVYSNGGYYAAPAVTVAPNDTVIIPQAVVAPQQNMILDRPPQNVVPGFAAPAMGPAGKITILNPSGSGGDVRYSLNGTDYTIREGSAQTFDNDRTWVVSFGSGGSKGDIRYTLSPGLFKFKVTGTGWDLVRAAEQPNSVSTFPQSSTIPPSPVPAPVPQP